eukprot:2245366-Pyramimonas_sp.AAC.1
MARFIPSSTGCFKSSHPWLDAECVSLVRKKCEAAGTGAFLAASIACSQGLLRAHSAYVGRVRARLQSLKRGSKQWWRLSDQLMHRTAKPS